MITTLIPMKYFGFRENRSPFLSGMGRSYDLFSVNKKLHIASDPHLADFNALVCDFRAVGEDIEWALDKYSDGKF